MDYDYHSTHVPHRGWSSAGKRHNAARAPRSDGVDLFCCDVCAFPRGRRVAGTTAWEECKRDLTAKGARLDWGYYIPPSVPADQNVFAVPEMTRWFVGRRKAANDLSARLSYPGHTNSARLVVAHVTLGLADATPPAGATVLPWLGEKGAQTDVAGLIMAALGPVTEDAAGLCHYMLKSPGEVQPVKLFLRCEKMPTGAELDAWLKILKAGLSADAPKLEAAGGNSYRVTVLKPVMAADYVAWGDKIEPDLAIMREAARRPYAPPSGQLRCSVREPDSELCEPPEHRSTAQLPGEVPDPAEPARGGAQATYIVAWVMRRLGGSIHTPADHACRGDDPCRHEGTLYRYDSRRNADACLGRAATRRAAEATRGNEPARVCG